MAHWRVPHVYTYIFLIDQISRDPTDVGSIEMRIRIRIEMVIDMIHDGHGVSSSIPSRISYWVSCGSIAGSIWLLGIGIPYQ